MHQDPQPALFGTVFGATVDLLSFRRSLGYRLVRLGSSPGDRSGAPAAVMLRPVTAEAEAICVAMQRELAWNLPFQVALLCRDGAVEPGLAEALAVGLPSVAPPRAAQVQAGLAAYLAGPRRSRLLVGPARRGVGRRPAAGTDAHGRRPGAGAALDLRPWPDLAEALGLGGVPATQRALRRALSALAPG